MLAGTWASLSGFCPSRNVFLRPAWTSQWLSTFGRGLQTRILTIHDEEDAIVGMTLVSFRTDDAKHLRMRRVYLGAYGEENRQSVATEYNGFVCRPGSENIVAKALVDYLGGERWDELTAHAMSDGPALRALEEALRDLHCQRVDLANPFVDFEALPAGADSYLSALSSNTRAQVRRCFRLYEERGPLTVQAAQDVPSALRTLDELAELHQATWTARGEHGAFASPEFLAFHRALISDTFDAGGVLLLRVLAGTHVIGLLYCLVDEGKVSFYQSGFHYEPDNRLKPGLTAHALAIQYCRDRGFREYDFLAGGSQYKRSLSTGSRRQAWFSARRPTWKVAALDTLRAVRIRIQSIPRRETRVQPA